MNNCDEDMNDGEEILGSNPVKHDSKSCLLTVSSEDDDKENGNV
jgi:hypothetical protein